MGSGFVDSLQLIIGIYLLYMGLKGENLGNRLSGVPDRQEVKEPRALRVLYIIGGVFALSDFAICMLRNNMFTVEQTQTGVSVTQNFTISALPFLTYDLMNSVSKVLSFLALAVLIGQISSLLPLMLNPKQELYDMQLLFSAPRGSSVWSFPVLFRSRPRQVRQ